MIVSQSPWRIALNVLTLTLLFSSLVVAQFELPNARPVPRLQVIPLPYHQASLRRDGVEITRYFFGDDLNRPFLFPMIGPSGHSLTRMGHPHDPNGHSHHNSLWISHNDVNGVVFWGDRGKGRIRHRRVNDYQDGDNQAAIDVNNVWQDESGKTLLEERRRMTVFPQENRQWLLVIDLQLSTPGEPVTLGKTPFGMIGVRMAKTIGVHDGGGAIRNSEGQRDEKEVFWKRAKWVDYSGPISPTSVEGITLMDHPGNINHPSHFHVRSDGWMGASLTFERPLTIEKGRPLSLRYGLWVHGGLSSAQRIDSAYASFIKVPAVSPRNK